MAGVAQLVRALGCGSRSRRFDPGHSPHAPFICFGIFMIFQCRDVHQVYQQGDAPLHILKGINFSLNAGEIVALVGASGSGKSTFLHLAGLLEKPSSGHITIHEHAVGVLNNTDLTTLRRTHIGFIYQFHHLLSEFTSLENVMMPLIIAGISPKIAREKAILFLEKMRLSHRLNHSPKKLSGGEQQRVAIARALIHEPTLLLADEPTGNLDDTTSAMVFDELMQLIRTQKLSALIATHDLELALKMDRIVRLHNGVLEEVAHANKGIKQTKIFESNEFV